MLGKTDFSPPMGRTFRERFGGGFGTKRESVSVMGLVRIRGVGAWKNGFFPSYGVYVLGRFR